MTVSAKVFDRHRSKVVIHKNGQYYLAEFASMEQFNEFAKTLGFKAKWETTREIDNVLVDYYSLNRKFAEGVCHDTEWGKSEYFWTLAELPEDVLPIVGHSNGRLVTCYFKNDGKTITIYRPNPNAKEVYKPLSTDAHIAYFEQHGGL